MLATTCSFSDRSAACQAGTSPWYCLSSQIFCGFIFVFPSVPGVEHRASGMQDSILRLNDAPSLCFKSYPWLCILFSEVLVTLSGAQVELLECWGTLKTLVDEWRVGVLGSCFITYFTFFHYSRNTLEACNCYVRVKVSLSLGSIPWFKR